MVTLDVLQYNDKKGNSNQQTAGLQLLTSVSGPLSAPGQQNVTNSWHLLWTTKQQTAGKKRDERKAEKKEKVRERFRERQITERREKERWLKYSVSLLTNM